MQSPLSSNTPPGTANPPAAHSAQAAELSELTKHTQHWFHLIALTVPSGKPR